MVLQDVYFVAEIIGVLAIIASLIFVGIQVRQNNRNSKAEAVQAAQQTMVDLSVVLSTDGAYAEMVHKSETSFNNLSREERFRLGWLWFAMMRTIETLYHHHLKGNADPEIWATHEASLAQNLRNPGFREWWRSLGYTMTAEFSELVDGMLEEAENSGEPYKWFGQSD